MYGSTTDPESSPMSASVNGPSRSKVLPAESESERERTGQAQARMDDGEVQLHVGSPDARVQRKKSNGWNSKHGSYLKLADTGAGSDDEEEEREADTRSAGAEALSHSGTLKAAATGGDIGATKGGSAATVPEDHPAAAVAAAAAAAEADIGDSVSNTVLEVVPALIISLAGLLAAGYTLDKVQSWTAFKRVHNLFVLVPVLLGLKGNLDMTLASRLSTAAHSGELDTLARARPILVSSLALVQVQALLVSLLAAIITCVSARAELTLASTLLIVTAAVTTMALSALVLGVFTCALVVLAHWHDFDPDNIATPLVSSLGDLMTLLCLAGMASALWDATQLPRNEGMWILWAACAATLLVLLPATFVITRRHDACRAVLVSGWPPILLAMLVSLVAGGFLDAGVSRFAGLAALVPVLSGSGGNLGCVYAARLCTALHMHAGDLSPVIAVERRRAWLLLMMAVPLSLLFLLIVRLSHLGHVEVDMALVTGYTVSACLQVSLILAFVHVSVPFFYRCGVDPDNYATPLLTALGDVLGSALILAAFHIMFGSTNL